MRGRGTVSTAKALPEGFTRDSKGRPCRDLGRFGTHKLLVYVSPPVRGRRRDESARVVLAGYFPELRVNVSPWQATQLDRRAALLLLWDRLIERIDAREAAAGAAADFEALLVAEGIKVPAGPLHRPGLPRLARAILAHRQAHPAASQRMIARNVGCDQGRVCQVFQKYGDPALGGDECAMNIHRRFIADSSRGASAENGISPDGNIENGAAGAGADSSPPLCTSSFFQKEDDGAPPPDAAEPRPALEGPSRPVVTGKAGGDSARPGMPRELLTVPEHLRPVAWAVVTIDAEADRPGGAVLWQIERRVRGGAEKLLAEAVELELLTEHGEKRLVWWTPRHPDLVRLAERVRRAMAEKKHRGATA